MKEVNGSREKESYKRRSYVKKSKWMCSELSRAEETSLCRCSAAVALSRGERNRRRRGGEERRIEEDEEEEEGRERRVDSLWRCRLECGGRWRRERSTWRDDKRRELIQ